MVLFIDGLFPSGLCTVKVWSTRLKEKKGDEDWYFRADYHTVTMCPTPKQRLSNTREK